MAVGIMVALPSDIVNLCLRFWDVWPEDLPIEPGIFQLGDMAWRGVARHGADICADMGVCIRARRTALCQKVGTVRTVHGL